MRRRSRPYRDHSLEELEALYRNPQIGGPALRRIRDELEIRGVLAQVEARAQEFEEEGW